MSDIAYPVEPHDIAILGKPDRFVRSFTLRPLHSGRFSLIVAPRHVIHNRDMFRHDLNFADLHGAPERVEFEIPSHLRKHNDWQWRLIRWPARPLQTAVTHLARGALDHCPTSTAEFFFLYPATVQGRFNLTEANPFASHSLMVWSCNQPFTTTESNQLAVEPTASSVLSWYKAQARRNDPDLIWILGDAAYSDGTEASNFIDTYYDNPGWVTDERKVDQLRHKYRAMYRGHWSFTDMQEVMRNYAHLCVWDDHEIRDGWGSESDDFQSYNRVIFHVAREVAQEYILNHGPRVRKPDDEPNVDAHQAYFHGDIAAFIFDGRSSRRYHDQQGHVISRQQFADFELFCDAVVENPEIRFVLMGCSVPFINLKDFVELIGSRAPKWVTDIIAGVRDDIRDSWHSPGNKAALMELMRVLRRLHLRRGDIEIVNISGDIHVANAFTFRPPGFHKSLYQVTTSALTNRQHLGKIGSDILSIGTEAHSDVLGVITRVWEEVSDPNLLLISHQDRSLCFELKVHDLHSDNPATLNSLKDKRLVVGAG